MDRFVATKMGEPLPVLGQEIIEDPEKVYQRKKGMKIEWNTDSVYTMALWSGKKFETSCSVHNRSFLLLNRWFLTFSVATTSDLAYADWTDWQILNFPGIRPFSITSLVGVQPIKLTLYTQQHHLERQVLFTMEVSHATSTTMGCEAQKWTAKTAAFREKTFELIDTIESIDIDSSHRNESFGEDDELDDQFDGDDKYEVDLVEADAELVDPESSYYLLSGSSVSLREGAGHYVASGGGGYAVLQSSRASIVLVKFQPKSKKKKAPLSSGAIIRSGDVVRVQLVDAGSKSVKFLGIYHKWWLRWSSARPKRPKRNGLFYIHTGEANGSPVILGSPFSLTSLRWRHYTVGACCDSSVKYGGRMLGICKTGKASANEDVGMGEEFDEIQENEIDAPPDSLPTEKDTRKMPLFLCAESWACSSPESLSGVGHQRRKTYRYPSRDSYLA